MALGITSFSRFIAQMNDRTRTDDAEGLARWAVQDLSQTLGFDAAWYGWAQLSAEGVQIYANATVNLPEGFYKHWQTMADQDLLAATMIESPGGTAIYDRRQARQTDGMVDLSDTFGLSKILTAMHGRPGRVTSFYLSSYRVTSARHWSQEERDYLQCAVDHLSGAMKLTTTEPGRPNPSGAVTILVNENGIGILGLSALQDQLGQIWPNWQGDHLPEQLRRLINLPGQHILPDRDLVVLVDNPPRFQGMGLRRLTLRRLTRMDMLTAREREVARALSDGKSHKEVARLLGLAPATVRNQTQSIYAKLGVDNRANLAAMVNQFAP